MLFAGYNGNQKVNKRKTDIQKVITATKSKDESMLKVLDSLEKDLKYL